MAYLELQMTYDRCGCDRDKITDLCGGGGPPRVDDNEITNDPRVRARGEAPAAILALGANERWEPKEPRQKWRVPEGLRMCRDRYAWNGTGAPVGVAISKAPPASFGASFGASCKGALGL